MRERHEQCLILSSIIFYLYVTLAVKVNFPIFTCSNSSSTAGDHGHVHHGSEGGGAGDGSGSGSGEVSRRYCPCCYCELFGHNGVRNLLTLSLPSISPRPPLLCSLLSLSLSSLSLYTHSLDFTFAVHMQFICVYFLLMYCTCTLWLSHCLLLHGVCTCSALRN